MGPWFLESLPATRGLALGASTSQSPGDEQAFQKKKVTPFPDQELADNPKGSPTCPRRGTRAISPRTDLPAQNPVPLTKGVDTVLTVSSQECEKERLQPYSAPAV